MLSVLCTFFVVCQVCTINGQEIVGSLLPGFPLSEILRQQISEKAIRITSELRKQLQDAGSPLAVLSRELRNIFENPPPSQTSTSPPRSIDASESEMMHYLRAVDEVNPFDFSSLAKESEEFEVIKVDDRHMRAGNTWLSHLLNSGFDVFLQGLNMQKKMADGRAHWRRLLAQSRQSAPKRILQSRPFFGKLGILNAVLGPPPIQRPAPPSLESIAGPLEAPGGIEITTQEYDHLPTEVTVENYENTTAVMDRLIAKYGTNILIEESDSCFLPGAEVLGANFLVVRAHDIYSCKKLCAKNSRCGYFTFHEDEHLCYEFTKITSLKPARKVMSGPKYCPGEEPRPQTTKVDTSESVKRQMENYARKSAPKTPEVLEGQQIAAIGGGLLNGGAISALSAASSVMTTGSQLMQALPLKELAQAGMQLAEAGYFRNKGIRGAGIGQGKNKDKMTLPPPPGSGTPSVACRVEGMTCCVPRQAVQDWQTKPPFLNMYDTPACRAVYVPTLDELCATSSYEGVGDTERCGLVLTDTATLQIYKHILTMPSRIVNNAICECIRHVQPGEKASIKGSARWEFSLLAAEELKQRKNETEQTAKKLARGANAAVALTQLLSKHAVDSSPALQRSAATSDPLAQTTNAFGAINQAVNLMGSLGSAMQQRRRKD